MNRFQLACQTITWGPKQSQHSPEVFAEIAAAGFTGVEIGFRHTRAIPAKELKAMLDKAGLKLVATHLSGNLEDRAQALSEQGMLEETLSYLKITGTSLLMNSGLRFENATQFARDLEALNRSAERCKKQGVRLLYHNHGWEFEDGARVMEALLRNGSPDLGLCPDLGWISKGGANVAEFLMEAGKRIGAVHFKDFATLESQTDTVVLGEGVVPLREAAEWLKANRPGIWAIAEQDHAEIPPAEAARRNAAFLRKLLS